MTGLSGSGKTWLAERLAPPLQAVHLRSDIERKRLAGLAPLARSASALARGLYARKTTVTVYERLAASAADALAGGYTTIVDATFVRADERLRFRTLAARLGVTLCIVYCRTPRQVLVKRIIERGRRRRDPSEANIDVLRWQEAQFTAPAAHEAGLVLEAAGLTTHQIVRRISAAAARQ